MLLRDFWQGTSLLMLYFAVAATAAILIRLTLHPPRELFRKLLHLISLGSIIVLLTAFADWRAAAGAPLLLAAALYPVLSWLEKRCGYAELLTERKCGEIKRSLLCFFLMAGILIALLWGGFGNWGKAVVAMATMAWGFGDAAAALVGKAFGCRPIRHRLVEGAKTIEGTTAMLLVSLLAIFVTACISGAASWPVALLVAVLTAPICAGVELVSRGGSDTVTVPFSAAIAISGLLTLFSGIGG